MNIPNKVKIGGLDYNIKESDVIVIDDKCNYGGVIRYQLGLIEIKKDMSITQKEQAFIHEILHGITDDRHIELEEDKEEDIIDSFASGLLAFIKDNPDLFNNINYETK
jgi:hypothetical protein